MNIRKMPDKKISVVLPFFRVGREFDLAISSIVQQTFDKWELLLISNNGSEEGLEISQQWALRDQRIRLLHEPVQGISNALNTGLLHASAPYIARMDADDVARPDRLQKQYDYLESHPEIGAVASQTDYNSTTEGSEGYALFVEWQNSLISAQAHALCRFIESPLAHPSIMFRRSLIDAYGPYSTDAIPEDYELWLRWMDNGVSVYKLPEILLAWNDHPARLSRTHENYSREAFYKVKCHYLAKWLKRNVAADKKIIVCGSSRIGRKRAAMLEEEGIHVFGFTDVKKRPNRQVNFIHYSQITDPEPWFLINFIARRGVGEAIREHFTGLDFLEGTDFILAG